MAKAFFLTDALKNDLQEGRVSLTAENMRAYISSGDIVPLGEVDEVRNSCGDVDHFKVPMKWRFKSEGFKASQEKNYK